ncbi:MAG: hypothetical protein E7184_02105 [Erysipelotrichaceae bacterium]|nr:hypothetical protein [Erysipelotrichaceae bacterium]
MASKYGNSFFMSEEIRKIARENLYNKLKQYDIFNTLLDAHVINISNTLISSLHTYVSNNNYNNDDYRKLLDGVIRSEFHKYKIFKRSELLINNIIDDTLSIFFMNLCKISEYDGNLETSAGKNIIAFIKK